MKVRVISPFDDAEQIWLGLDHPGQRRKVFRFVSPEIGSEEFMAGITVFEPGESSSLPRPPGVGGDQRRPDGLRCRGLRR